MFHWRAAWHKNQLTSYHCKDERKINLDKHKKNPSQTRGIEMNNTNHVK